VEFHGEAIRRADSSEICGIMKALHSDIEGSVGLDGDIEKVKSYRRRNLDIA
jgi:hypothetical protein